MSDPKKPAPLPQNPSPMADSIRAHERVEERTYPGVRSTIDDLLPQPIHLFLPEKLKTIDECSLLVHFHGTPFVAEYAVHVASLPHALAVVNLGAGSGVYERPFSAAGLFAELLSTIKNRVTAKIIRVHFSAFSAGYGAVRAILRQDSDAADGVILLDGLHANYDPDCVPLAEGGQVDPSGLDPFLVLAQRAIAGEQRSSSPTPASSPAPTLAPPSAPTTSSELSNWSALPCSAGASSACSSSPKPAKATSPSWPLPATPPPTTSTTSTPSTISSTA